MVVIKIPDFIKKKLSLDELEAYKRNSQRKGKESSAAKYQRWIDEREVKSFRNKSNEEKREVFFSKDQYGRIPLRRACDRGDVGMVKAWLNINDISKEDKFRAICVEEAIYVGDHGVGMTILTKACKSGNVAVVNALLNAPGMENEDRVRAISAASRDGRTPLIAACDGGNVALVNFLLTASGMENEDRVRAVSAASIEGRTPLMVACYIGNVALVNFLLTAPGMGDEDRVKAISATDIYGRTPLMLACHSSNVALVNSLLTAPGMENEDRVRAISAAAANGCTPLIAACDDGNVALVDSLLTAPGMTDALRQDVLNMEDYMGIRGRPIAVAFESGNHEVVRYLQDRHNVRLPEYLQERAHVGPGGNIRVNTRQSTHASGVHDTVSKSITNLKRLYWPGQDKTDCDLQIESMRKWADGLFSNEEHKPLYELSPDQAKEFCARNAINRIFDHSDITSYVDSRSNISLLDALALTWKGIHDETSISELSGGFDLKKRLECFRDHLYETQRGYNFDANDNDDFRGADRPICVPGHFNKIVSSLVTLHKEVEICVVTDGLVKQKGLALIGEVLSKHEDVAKRDRLFDEWYEEMVGTPEIWDCVKERVKEELDKEFGPFIQNAERMQRLFEAIGEECETFPPPQWYVAKKAAEEKAAEERAAVVAEEAVVSADLVCVLPRGGCDEVVVEGIANQTADLACVPLQEEGWLSLVRAFRAANNQSVGAAAVLR